MSPRIERPETRYTRSGPYHVAYQTLGSGGIDLVFVPWFWTHVEVQWEEPLIERFLRRLASFSRLILFDKRGAGLSDPVPMTSPPALEEWMDDLRAVLDAAESRSAAIVAHSGGGLMSMLFAATYPERVSHLAILEGYARLLRGADYPIGAPRAWLDSLERVVSGSWGTGSTLPPSAPTLVAQPSVIEWFGRYERMAASPGSALAMLKMISSVDVRAILPQIQAPTLLLHRTANPIIPIAHGRYLAEHLPNARLVELPGSDHAFFSGDTASLLDRIQDFTTGRTGPLSSERLLATVLFLDIVESTSRAARLGDASWREVLDQHDAVIVRLVAQHLGHVVKHTGDGVMARFDGPTRAVLCGTALRQALRAVGIDVRVGLHTGEIILRGDDIAGIAVHLAARVQGSASPGEVLVSSTVRDLVLGSGIQFEDRGIHTLKGIPDAVRLFAVQ